MHVHGSKFEQDIMVGNFKKVASPGQKLPAQGGQVVIPYTVCNFRYNEVILLGVVKW
jgi:hypothetical protein